jgi:hypothetical protein
MTRCLLYFAKLFSKLPARSVCNFIVANAIKGGILTKPFQIRGYELMFMDMINNVVTPMLGAGTPFGRRGSSL